MGAPADGRSSCSRSAVCGTCASRVRSRTSAWRTPRPRTMLPIQRRSLHVLPPCWRSLLPPACRSSCGTAAPPARRSSIPSSRSTWCAPVSQPTALRPRRTRRACSICGLSCPCIPLSHRSATSLPERMSAMAGHTLPKNTRAWPSCPSAMPTDSHVPFPERYRSASTARTRRHRPDLHGHVHG